MPTVSFVCAPADASSATDETLDMPSSQPSSSSEDVPSLEGGYGGNVARAGGYADRLTVDAVVCTGGSLQSSDAILKGGLVGAGTDSLSTSSNSSVSNVEV